MKIREEMLQVALAFFAALELARALPGSFGSVMLEMILNVMVSLDWHT